MEESRSNSHRSKQNNEQIPEKRVNAVVSGQAKTKKKSGFRKVADALIAEDASNVRDYIFSDVIIPSLKKTINDVVTNTLEMFLYGKSGGVSKTSSSKISYRSYYDGKKSDNPGYPSAKNPCAQLDAYQGNHGNAAHPPAFQYPPSNQSHTFAHRKPYLVAHLGRSYGSILPHI